MVRSAAALAAVLILPGFLLAQEAPRTHTVVDGDTLWDLASAYYGNPFDWRAIWNANRDRVEDPNLITPGQELVIPGQTQAVVTEVVVAGDPPENLPEIEAAPGELDATDADERTVFYRDDDDLQQVLASRRLDYLAVSRDLVYSAPWLVGVEEVPAHRGVIVDFATGSGRSETPRAYDRVHIRMRPGVAARVGDQFLIYRTERTIPTVGDVVKPRGILTVTDVEPDGIVALVLKEYDRIALGDYLGPLPPYTLTAGTHPRPIMGGTEAMVMGFSPMAQLPDLNSVAFLDLGSDQGISIGDEFVYENRGAGDIIEGRLQVVGVTPRTAAARILSMDDAVFEQGTVVRLSRSMR